MTEQTVSGIARAVAEAGSQRRLAQVLGVSQAEIWRWVKRGWAPARHVVAIEATYGVPRRDLLRPEFVDLLDSGLGED